MMDIVISVIHGSYIDAVEASHADAADALFIQAMSILRGQLPWRKRQRPEATPGPASPVPLRSAMSAPSGALEALMPPAEEGTDGEWNLSGPYTFDRWRDMIERCDSAFNSSYYTNEIHDLLT